MQPEQSVITAYGKSEWKPLRPIVNTGCWEANRSISAVYTVCVQLSSHNANCHSKVNNGLWSGVMVNSDQAGWSMLVRRDGQCWSGVMVNDGQA